MMSSPDSVSRTKGVNQRTLNNPEGPASAVHAMLVRHPEEPFISMGLMSPIAPTAFKASFQSITTLHCRHSGKARACCLLFVTPLRSSDASHGLSTGNIILAQGL